jgi:hypothetical protein
MSLQEPSHKSSTPPPDHHARKRPVSDRKILANRKNALLSTGPKTERGKRAVSRNAIKHGLLAREVVITTGDGEESLEEFHALVEGLEKCYAPVGTIEETFVQTIATCMWRKARVMRAENGEIRKRLDTLSIDRALRSSDKANLGLALSEMDIYWYSAENQSDQKVSTMDRWSAMQVAQSNLREHRSGLEYLNALLEIAKSEIASDGHMSEKIRKKIFWAFCFSDYFFAVTCRSAGARESKMEDPPPKQGTDEEIEAERALSVAYIDIQLNRISAFKEYALEREKLAGDAEARSFSLPPVDATDKLLRYEAHLDRQLYRAMDQLERLQRQRRGEKVPPPLNINLGKRT